MLTIDLLRHGELQGGIKYRGQTDDPLTAAGRLAMNRAWQHIATSVDSIISSPLRRCAQPATAWARASGTPCIIEPRLAEMYYGDWEGKSIATIQNEYPGMIEQWRRDPTGMRPPGGESPEELLDRLSAWWVDAQTQFAGQHILVIAHSGSLRMLITHLLGQPIADTRSIRMPYACRYRIIHEYGKTHLLDVAGPETNA